MTLGGFVCGCPPMDGGLSWAVLAARATGETYASVFARDSLKSGGLHLLPASTPRLFPQSDQVSR